MEAERHTREQDRVFINYENLLRCPVEEIRRANNALGLTTPDAAQNDITEYVVDRPQREPTSFETDTPEMVSAVWGAMSNAPTSPQTAALCDNVYNEIETPRFPSSAVLFEQKRHLKHRGDIITTQIESIEKQRQIIEQNKRTIKANTDEIEQKKSYIEKISSQLDNTLNALDSQKRHVDRLTSGMRGFAIRGIDKSQRALAHIRHIIWKRRFEYSLEPLKSVEEQDARYFSLDQDPQMRLASTQQGFPSGWVAVSYDPLQSPSVLRPRLYADDGQGWTERWSARLASAASGAGRTEETFCRLPDIVYGLRFDPMDTPGAFQIGSLNIREISHIELFIGLARKKIESRKAHNLKLTDYIGWIWRRLREGGLTHIKHKLVDQGDSNSYEAWINAFHDLSDEDGQAILKDIETLKKRPLISVIMPTYNTPPQYLRQAIDSVKRQLYSDWELCISDDCSTDPQTRELLQLYENSDPRIKIHWRTQNGGISQTNNSAIAIAKGEYCAFLDHDDELTPHALYMIARAVEDNDCADIIYTDSDNITETGHRFDPFFKPDWNYDLLLAFNYFNHLTAYRTQIIKDVGGFKSEYDGSQDYDLALRAIEKAHKDGIIHVPHILYHWRVLSTSFSKTQKQEAVDAGQKALQSHFDRIGGGAEIEPCPRTEIFHKARFTFDNEPPLVSILIPTRDQLNLLYRCVDSILKKTTGVDYEILIINNQSKEQDTLTYFDEIQKKTNVRVINFNNPFNFSAINNFAADHAHGNILAFVNNDIEVITPNWLEEMTKHAMRPDIGAVGAKLYYEDETIQHGGVICGIGANGKDAIAGHAHRHFPKNAKGYFWRLLVTHQVSAVTAACMVMRKTIFDEAGGFDAEHLPIAYNDVDLCLKIRALGYANLWTPDAELYHFESKSRGADTFGDKKVRLQNDVTFMREKWGDDVLLDPYYNPNLTLNTEDFALAFPPRAHCPWRT
ncbi:MAG: glycosyltransferase [Pseudomonadota bacterium]